MSHADDVLVIDATQASTADVALPKAISCPYSGVHQVPIGNSSRHTPSDNVVYSAQVGLENCSFA